jgi:hypothetical protein
MQASRNIEGGDRYIDKEVFWRSKFNYVLWLCELMAG